MDSGIMLSCVDSIFKNVFILYSAYLLYMRNSIIYTHFLKSVF